MIDPCFPSVSEAQLHLNFDVSEFDLTANAIDGPSISSQLCSQVASVCPRPGQYSADSASSQEDADTSLPNDWGLRILSLLSKDRTQAATADCNTSPSESINGDCQQQASEQAATEPRDQPVEDRDTRQREKNKRAQKRHRDRLKVLQHSLEPQAPHKILHKTCNKKLTFPLCWLGKRSLCLHLSCVHAH